VFTCSEKLVFYLFIGTFSKQQHAIVAFTKRPRASVENFPEGQRKKRPKISKKD